MVSFCTCINRFAEEMTIFGLALSGASIGFLWFNAHPAEVFMGDTGSLALGGAIGVMAILLKGEFLLVNVDDAEGGEKVRVRMPLALVDALLDSENGDNSLNLAAALKVLSEFEGDLVTVQDGDEMVRIWIDNNNFINE